MRLTNAPHGPRRLGPRHPAAGGDVQSEGVPIRATSTRLPTLGFISRGPFGLRFFDNNDRLISVGYDATVRIWELNENRLLKLARQIAGRELSNEERAEYGLEITTR